MTYHPTVIDFVYARLRDEERAVADLDDADPVKVKRMRELAFDRSVTDQIRHVLKQNRAPATDHPLATGLLLLADVWREHEDFDVDLWFPTLLKGQRPQGESHGARRG